MQDKYQITQVLSLPQVAEHKITSGNWSTLWVLIFKFRSPARVVRLHILLVPSFHMV